MTANSIWSANGKSILLSIFPNSSSALFKTASAISKQTGETSLTMSSASPLSVHSFIEYTVAEGIKPLLLEKMGIEIDEHEVGYIALHIHSAIDTENVSQSMIIAQGVRECISMVETETGRKINVLSISYNRLMNHFRNCKQTTSTTAKQTTFAPTKKTSQINYG